jgi:Isoprenylcysteine carboxyl methyltransferase (ICMT) family
MSFVRQFANERPGMELGGVYRSVRHPMYASMWLWGVAQTMLLQNRVAGFSSLALFLPLYLPRVPREEQVMVEEFGDEYRSYMSQTGRIIPVLENSPEFASCGSYTLPSPAGSADQTTAASFRLGSSSSMNRSDWRRGTACMTLRSR